MRRHILALTISTAALSGCEHGGIFRPAEPPSLVPVSQVVNAIKCELAQTFQNGRFADVVKEEAPPGKADIKGALNLSNVVAFGRSVEAGGEVVPLGVTFGPSIAYARTWTTGQAYELKFSYDLQRGSGVPAFCSTLEVQVEGDPFVLMLEGIKAEHAKLGKGEPKVQLGTIAYTSKFELKREETAGAKLKFLVFSLGGKASDSRIEGQTLTLVFDLGELPELVA